MQFLKNILASFLALVIFTGGFFLIGILIIGAISSEDPVKVKEGSVLHLKLNKQITELEYEDPLGDIAMISGRPNTIGVIQLLSAIEEAKDDSRIKGIYLETSYLMSGFAVADEIRTALKEFKESGKFIVSYAANYSEGGYYLASVSNKVLLHPEGFLEFNGVNASVMFFTGLFEKLDIEAQIFRVGEYKSAIEPFTLKKMSDENREQLTELINEVNGHLMEAIAADRNLTMEEVSEISSKMLIRDAEDAVELGFVDQLVQLDELKPMFQELLELDEGTDPDFISYFDYRKTYSKYSKSKNEIRVIVATGDIVEGGTSEMIDGKKYASLIRKAREDDDVKAIVLRVNSPGGQMQASDMIWREIKLTTEKKPVIASFSDYAASGGYYIAMAADTIVASRSTITGSIGIFGMLFNFGNMMENKLGITMDEVNTGEFSGMYTISRSLKDNERAIIQNNVNKGYETFTSKVADSRGMDIEELKKIASGRVWTGSQALENGLVDRIGGIRDAINIAGEAAKIEDYKLTYWPVQKSFLEELMNAGDNSSEEVLVRELGDHYIMVKKMQQMLRYQGIQARAPWELSF